MVHGLTPAGRAQASTSGPRGDPSAPFLIGHGYDIHRLEKKVGKRVLAGVTVSEELSPMAHSDGDVIYHAIVDAMLGALGIGDIGELFGDSDPKWKGASSDIFMTDVLSRVRQAGYRVNNVDVSLILERPKILSCKPQMVANIRRLLEPVAVVNLKAGTNEQCDSIGRGEAVAAHAVVLLARQA
jgi:2-C-methyl-D-erythritol 2,4-cyclodiphosphate synthase